MPKALGVQSLALTGEKKEKGKKHQLIVVITLLSRNPRYL
jgi:hypothetical protein